MADENAIWHVLIEGVQRGPFTKSQVLEFLRDGTLAGHDLIWRPGLSDWKSVSEIKEFWQPPPPRPMPSVKVASQPPPLTQQSLSSVEPVAAGQKWNLWKSASIGLLVSALTLALQVANGRGFELANYAHTRSAETISGLVGQTLAAPLIFVLVALVRNLFKRGQPKSSASAVVWGSTFAGLLLGVSVALFTYGESFFASDDVVSGETRKVFVADFHSSCTRKQRSISPTATESQILSYCACVSEKAAGGTTYRQLGTEPDARALADLKQRIEAAGYSCR